MKLSKDSFIKQTIMCLILNLIFLILETYTDFDMSIQRKFFNVATSEWLITYEMHRILTYIFYTGYKTVLIILSLIALIKVIKGFRVCNKELIRNNILFIGALALTPTIVAGLKATTNIYCPYQLQEFGGKYTYQRVLEPANPANNINSDYHKGRGFPAGHASGGFALMVLFYIFKREKCWYGFLIGQIVGWVTGMYQVIRGEHFVSHNFITMFIAWQIIITLVFFVDKKLHSSESNFLNKIN